MLERNKQDMYYSRKLSDNTTPIYATDSSGNVIYDDIDGESIPRETGDYRGEYLTPVAFSGNISNTIAEELKQAFGSYADNACQLMLGKDEIPLEVGDSIWKDSEIEYYSDGAVNPDTCDYHVVGSATNGLSVDLFLLKKNVKQEGWFENSKCTWN